MKALVTGANGLVGSALVRALLRAGHDVRAFVRPTADLATLQGLAPDRHVGDVRDHAAVTRAASGRDVIFHTAVPFHYGQDPAGHLHEVATVGTTAVLRAARATGVDRVVVTSSSVVFGHATGPTVFDESAGLAASAGQPSYVAAKIAQDAATLDRAADLGVDVVLACPAVAIGPTAGPLGPSNAIVVQYLADPWRSTFRGGIDIVAVADVAAGHVLVAEHGATGRHYLLGGDNLAWRDLHDLVAELAGVGPPTWTATHTAAWMGAAIEEARARVGGRKPLVTREEAGMVGRWYWYDHARATRLGYRPRPAREALAATIAWLAASRHVSREVRATMHLHPDVVAAGRASARADRAFEET